jgi:hypothetical protein
MKTIFKGSYGWLSALCLLMSSSAFAYGGWGVIVFNPQTGSWGAAHGASSRADAENTAMAACGSDCANVDPASLENRQSVLRETFGLNAWIAFASDGNGHLGTAGTSDSQANAVIHSSQANAEASAVQNCSANGKYNCSVVRSLASYDNQDDVDGTVAH